MILLAAPSPGKREHSRHVAKSLGRHQIRALYNAARKDGDGSPPRLFRLSTRLWGHLAGRPDLEEHMGTPWKSAKGEIGQALAGPLALDASGRDAPRARGICVEVPSHTLAARRVGVSSPRRETSPAARSAQRRARSGARSAGWSSQALESSQASGLAHALGSPQAVGSVAGHMIGAARNPTGCLLLGVCGE